MEKTRLYIARHGKTMFNTIGRAQGWSDTPLTDEGEQGIKELGVGLKDAGLVFGVGGGYTYAGNNYTMESPYVKGLKIKRDHDTYKKIPDHIIGNFKYNDSDHSLNKLREQYQAYPNMCVQLQ